jgi:hypothetical protein
MPQQPSQESPPDPQPLPTLPYATPSPQSQNPRRSGIMGLFLGLAWLPSELVYSPTLRGRILSALMFIATVAVILIIHREFTHRRKTSESTPG